MYLFCLKYDLQVQALKRFSKIYIEITNICNLNCEFCPGTHRDKARISVDNFAYILDKIKPYTDYIYLHLMGEPLVHPDLGQLIFTAKEKGFHICITTNGVLLNEKTDVLENGEKLHKISISLQAQEANSLLKGRDSYLENCFEFGKKAAENCIVAYRLWNEGGADSQNGHILEVMERYFPKPWDEHARGYRLCKNVYLERGEVFDWPEIEIEETNLAASYSGKTDLKKNNFTAKNINPPRFCYGLRDQVGILVDGTVVPCCLDHNGDIPLGNINTDDFGDIINSDRAQRLYNGFSEGKAVEPLCQNCGYATRFN